MYSQKKLLPVGEENFAYIRRNNLYYVDKTQLIEKLLTNWGKANLFTRPRRFGKSLNMSMLKNFFEIGCDKQLFDGLYIAQKQEICEKYMGRFPVVSMSLKSVEASSFDGAKQMLAKIVNEEARRLQFLLQSSELTDIDKKVFLSLLDENMPESTLVYSIRELTELLCKHYGKAVIVLIDEYDVPLAKANENHYYDKMVGLIRGLFANVIKTNDNLQFAVLTGCLRVAKESIFTGLNNFKVHSLTSVAFDEYFGFTDAEVKEMLRYYDQSDQYDIVKDWYDGYRFGNVDVYCPWDVICYISDHVEEPEKEPDNYWLNTSDNSVIYHFIDNMGKQRQLTKAELEELVNGGTVQKEISQELTYKDMYASADNIWSALFMTGYLTQRGEPEGKRYNLVVPNLEIRNIIVSHVLLLFQRKVEEDGKLHQSFCQALERGEDEKVEQLLNEYMAQTISIRDTASRKNDKENFYHGILMGVLSFRTGWTTQSNMESGNGYSDIVIWSADSDIGIVLELKYAEDGLTDRVCKKALEQIEKNNYADVLRRKGCCEILKYGIAFYKKSFRVMLEREVN